MNDEENPLFQVQNAFYIGNYQLCINEASKLKNLSNNSSFLRDVYVYRSYIGMKKYKLVSDEINSKKDGKLYLLKVYADYLNGKNEDIIHELATYTDKDFYLYKIIASIIYMCEENYQKVFETLQNSNDLECLSMLIQLYLQIHRIDLATKVLGTMQSMDEDSPLTQLSIAWVNLYLGGEKAKESFYIFNEFCEKYPPSITLLNGLGAAHLQLQQYDDAEKVFRKALEKDPDHAETILNLYKTLPLSNKHSEETSRLLNQIRSEHSDEEFSKNYDEKSKEFDALAENYLQMLA